MQHINHKCKTNWMNHTISNLRSLIVRLMKLGTGCAEKERVRRIVVLSESDAFAWSENLM